MLEGETGTQAALHADRSADLRAELRTTWQINRELAT
jgi:hypothetical protein